MCPKKIKESPYQTLVRPHLEYASSAWDPYTDKNIKMIERIQKKAARFVTGNYTYTKGTMTAIMEDLKWMSLEKRRKIYRLTLLHKAIHKQNNLIIPEYVKRKTHNTRRGVYTELPVSSDQYKYSFFPRTIKDFNELPPDIMSPSPSTFRKNITLFLN